MIIIIQGGINQIPEKGRPDSNFPFFGDKIHENCIDDNNMNAIQYPLKS